MKPIGLIIIVLFAFTSTACFQSGAKYKIPDINSFEESYIGSENYLTSKRNDGYSIDFQRLNLEKSNNWIGITEEEVFDIASKNSRNPDILTLVSSYHLSNGDIDKSQAFCDRVKKLGGKSIDYYILRSQIHAKKGENDIAIDQINRAILVNRFDPELYKEKGQLYLDFGDTLSAINYLKKSMLLDTTKLESCILIAQLFSQKRDYESASYWLERGLLFDANNMKLRFVQSDIYRSAGLDNEANEVLKHLLETGSPIAGERLLNFFVESSEYDSVLNYANQLIVLDSLNMSALLSKGVAFDRKGYFSSSLNYYEQALSVDSTNQEAIQGMHKVKGKIAYLRKIREQRESIPTFDFLIPTEKKILN